MSILSGIFGFGRTPEEQEAELYEKGMREYSEAELEEERAAKVAEARIKLEMETQAKIDAARIRAEAERVEKEAVRGLPRQERQIAEAELERRRSAERLTAERAKAEERKRLAGLEYETRRVREEAKVLRAREGVPEAALQSGFIGEYKKIMRLIRAGRGRAEDIQMLRSLYAESTAYGIDEETLKEITHLRRKIEGQGVAKKGVEAVESIPRVGVRALSTAGALVSGRGVTVGGRRPGVEGIQVGGRPAVEQAAGARPVRASDILGISQAALSILGSPVRRARPEQFYKSAESTQDASEIGSVPEQQVGRLKLPGIKAFM